MLPGASWAHRRLALRPNPAPTEASYGIWLKHLCLASTHTSAGFPRRVAELGPGLSIGVGLAALVSGAEFYGGFDVIPFVKREPMLEVFDQLVTLFRKRTRPANASGFPDYQDALDSDGFPSNVLGGDHLERALDPERLANLREQVQAFARNGNESDHPSICFRAPWRHDGYKLDGGFDLVLSHTVLQHVVELEETVRQLRRWLRPGGVTTHQINFDCHGVASTWNGHWACPKWQWRLALGRKDFLINRIPVSVYLDLAEKAGLDVLQVFRRNDLSGYPRDAFPDVWRNMSTEDAVTRGAFIVAGLP